MALTLAACSVTGRLSRRISSLRVRRLPCFARTTNRVRQKEGRPTRPTGPCLKHRAKSFWFAQLDIWPLAFQGESASPVSVNQVCEALLTDGDALSFAQRPGCF